MRFKKGRLVQFVILKNEGRGEWSEWDSGSLKDMQEALTMYYAGKPEFRIVKVTYEMLEESK